jgi:hypothetical protein
MKTGEQEVSDINTIGNLMRHRRIFLEPIPLQFLQKCFGR